MPLASKLVSQQSTNNLDVAHSSGSSSTPSTSTTVSSRFHLSYSSSYFAYIVFFISSSSHAHFSRPSTSSNSADLKRTKIDTKKTNEKPINLTTASVVQKTPDSTKNTPKSWYKIEAVNDKRSDKKYILLIVFILLIV